MTGIDVFPMIPASTRSLVPLLVGVIIVVLLIAGVFAYLGFASQRVRFEISQEGLHIRGALFGRLVPASAIDSGGAVPLDLDRAPSFRPRKRTFGAGLPGYRAGWFTLQNGDKALLFVTDPTSVAYIPTTEGYSLVLSVADPTAMIAALAKVSPRTHETFHPPGYELRDPENSGSPKP